MSETKILISEATKRNWDKLKADGNDRLMRRANKSRSQRIIIPEGYVSAGSLPRFVEELRAQQYPIKDLIFSLCALYLEHNKVNESNKKRFFEEYPHFRRLSIEVPRQIIKNRQDDWIGFVYQSLTTEGSRILTGLYYTSPVIVEEMLQGIELTHDQRFLDALCRIHAYGDGSFKIIALSHDARHTQKHHQRQNHCQNTRKVLHRSIRLLIIYRFSTECT